MSQIKFAYLHRPDDGRLGVEIQSAARALEIRGVRYRLFPRKDLNRGRLELSPETLVVGHIPVVLQALRRIGVDLEPVQDYPDAIHPWLRRRVWTSTVREVMARVHDEVGLPVFVKPAAMLKKFAGGVIASWSDLHVLRGASDSTPVLCAEVVEWLSEYRAYVANGRILGVHYYAGDPQSTVDDSVVESAVAQFEASDAAVSGYAMDFGVLRTGETGVVELNDGYGLGSYGLADGDYLDLLIARWSQMTAAV